MLTDRHLNASEILSEAEKERDIAKALYVPKPNKLEKAWIVYMESLIAASRLYLQVADSHLTAE